MKNSQKDLDKIFSKILNEEINNKASLLMEKKFGDGRDKIDVAEPKGKITGADFKMLRSMKKKETTEETETCEQCGGQMQEGECMECGRGGMYEYDDIEIMKSEKKSKKEPTYLGRGLEDNKLMSSLKNKLSKIRKRLKMGEAETEEGNEFSLNLMNARKEGKKEFEVGGKTYPVKESKTYSFTEKEMIDIIESIVLQEKDNIEKKKVATSNYLEKSNNITKKEKDSYMKELENKMKGYLKTGSKGKYEMNPEQFPKGNGELGEMDKKAYKASGAVEEYIENFAYSAGMENLDYDEIKPNEEWVDDNIKGSSRTGNNPKWANALETELGEKIVKKKNKNLYSQAKKDSYQKAKQPVDTAGEHEGEKSLDKMFKTLESTEKKENRINEEVNKMFDLMKYNQKTQ